jgi:hypothetical integral membrane protein (TIGR02206 family)
VDHPFRLFSTAHFAALAGVAVFCWAMVYTGRRLAHRRPLEVTLALLNLAVWAAAHGWWQMPPRFDPITTLPLQMCHIASLIASVVLLTGNTLLRPVLYFWGLALCTQAMITPSLVDPPTSHIFWTFWFLHGFVLMTAVYDLIVNGFRPGWRDYGIAAVASMTYVTVTFFVNLALGSNYGFTGQSKPLNPSIVDLLGPWPERLLPISLLAALAMFLALAPWLAWRKWRTWY